MQQAMQHSALSVITKSILAVCAALFLFSCSRNAAELPQTGNPVNATQASSNRPEDNNHAVPLEDWIYVSCANGGAGEDVQLSGYSNFVYQLIWGDNGFTFVYHDNLSQVRGVGVTSGETFVATGGINGITRGSWENEKWSTTITRRIRLIGRNASFTYIYKYHLTVLRDGTVIVRKTDEKVSCEK